MKLPSLLFMNATGRSFAPQKSTVRYRRISCNAVWISYMNTAYEAPFANIYECNRSSQRRRAGSNTDVFPATRLEPVTWGPPMDHPSLLFMNAGVLTATRLGPVARTLALKPPFATIYTQPSLWPGARHGMDSIYPMTTI